jgi:tellurite resistance protein TerC
MAPLRPTNDLQRKIILNAHELERKHRSPFWRRLIVLFAGGITLTAGLAMLILPGPAIIFIPLGLTILATEFRWARRLLSSARQWIRRRYKKLH